MGRFWSLLFLLVPVLGVGVFVCAMMTETWPLYGHWLPEIISEHGLMIDRLFMFILYLTGIIFICTGWALFWFMWKYDAARNTSPVKFVHGSHTLEIIWSILPAAVLLFIAIYQMDAWAGARMRRPLDPGPDRIVGTADDPAMLPGPDGVRHTDDDVPVSKPPLAKVTGRQFEWRIRYAGKDRIVGTADDIHTVNELHVPVDEEVVIQIETEDVLHSFFLPNARVKQDLVPGMEQYVWFQLNTTGTYDLVCAELCGWGHYKMKGRLTVEPREQLERWLEDRHAEQELNRYASSEGDE